MVDQIMTLPERTKIQLLAPMVRGRKGRHEKVLEQAKRSGYVRVMIDGNLHELSEEITLEKNVKHNIEIVVDRLVVEAGDRETSDGLHRDGDEAVRWSDDRGCSWRRADQLQPELFLPGLRDQHRGGGAAKLLLQQPVRRLPGLFRSGI